MYEVNYARPTTLTAALDLLKKTGGRPLAGGQSILGAMKLRLAQPGSLVDLGAIPELRGIRRVDDSVVIGATMRHAEVATSELVRQCIPSLARLAGGIGDRQVRNMGTIGGSIANNDPAACYPAALLGLGATVQTDRRSMQADEFFRGMYGTALEDDEVIRSVIFPIPLKAGYEKFEQPASRFALVGVFVVQMTDSVRVAVTGAATSVFRCIELENALRVSFTQEAARAVTLQVDGMSRDLHASDEYRAHLVSVIAARAVAQAIAHKRTGSEQ